MMRVAMMSWPKLFKDKALRKVTLVVAACFLVVSFGFMGGWPFLSQDEEPPTLQNQQEEAKEPAKKKEAEHKRPSPKGLPDEGLLKVPAVAAVTKEIRASRDQLSRAKKSGARAYRLALTKAVLNDKLPKNYRMNQLGVLRQINLDTVFRPGSFKPTVEVRIARGDSLTRIARRVKKAHGNNVTPAFLMKMNRLPNSRIRAGNLLSAPTENLSVLISKSDFRLYVLLGKSIVLDYPVGIGHSNKTPEGEYTIQGKTKNPTWTRPDGKVIAFGEEGHTIGTRWLGFSDKRGRTPYGIHGTVENASIGQAKSEGCIRMLKDDVEEVFQLIPEGCLVSVRP